MLEAQAEMVGDYGQALWSGPADSEALLARTIWPAAGFTGSRPRGPVDDARQAGR